MNTIDNKTEQELNEGLYMVETEERLETVQAVAEASMPDLSCCGDS